MPSKKKSKKPLEQREEEAINKALLEDSLALAATERQINEDADIEERLRRIEQYEREGTIAPPKRRKKK